MVKRHIVKEWFSKADNDIKDAEFLFKHKRSLETASFLVQQAAEKYLKGFLISQGKSLEKTHDLVKLLQDAINIDTEFVQFKGAAKRVTNFYFESRYPLGYDVEYTEEEIKDAITDVKKLIKLIQKKTK